MKITLGDVEIEVDGYGCEITIPRDGKSVKIAYSPDATNPPPTLIPPYTYIPCVPPTYVPPIYNQPQLPYIVPGPIWTTPNNTIITQSGSSGYISTLPDHPVTGDPAIIGYQSAEPEPTDTVSFEGRVRVDGVAGESFGARVYSAPPK